MRLFRSQFSERTFGSESATFGQIKSIKKIELKCMMLDPHLSSVLLSDQNTNLLYRSGTHILRFGMSPACTIIFLNWNPELFKFCWHQEPYEAQQEWTMKRSRSAKLNSKNDRRSGSATVLTKWSETPMYHRYMYSETAVNKCSQMLPY